MRHLRHTPRQGVRRRNVNRLQPQRKLCLPPRLQSSEFPTVRCSMNRCNSATEYSTILPTRVTGGTSVRPLPLQLLSAEALTPRSFAAACSRRYCGSASALGFGGEVPIRATTPPTIFSMSSSSCNPVKAGRCSPKKRTSESVTQSRTASMLFWKPASACGTQPIISRTGFPMPKPSSYFYSLSFLVRL